MKSRPEILFIKILSQRGRDEAEIGNQSNRIIISSRSRVGRAQRSGRVLVTRLGCRRGRTTPFAYRYPFYVGVVSRIKFLLRPMGVHGACTQIRNIPREMHGCSTWKRSRSYVMDGEKWREEINNFRMEGSRLFKGCWQVTVNLIITSRLRRCLNKLIFLILINGRSEIIVTVQ